MGLSAFLAPQAHAIIFLPAIVLIPIAKIVAVIIGGFSFPALGVGAGATQRHREIKIG